MNNRIILVTGGAGYVGSHACKALAEAGYIPITFDNLSYGHKWAVKWGPLFIGDILDRSALDKAISFYRPFAVMHFAALAYVGESVEHPAGYYRNNVVGSLNLLEAMRAGGINKIVFSSSCATYGICEEWPTSEDAQQAPVNPYGASKLMVERMLMDFRHAYNLQSVALRYFNAAGADPEGDIGELHDPETHLVPLILAAAAGSRPNVTIFGDDYPTHDGTCLRDFVHVSDLADAHVRALQRFERGLRRSAYNLGSGQGVSVRQLIDVAQRITGRRIPVAIGQRRAGDPPVLIADSSAAVADLDWSPRLSRVEAIIESAWAWQTVSGRFAAAPSRTQVL